MEWSAKSRDASKLLFALIAYEIERATFEKPHIRDYLLNLFSDLTKAKEPNEILFFKKSKKGQKDIKLQHITRDQDIAEYMYLYHRLLDRSDPDWLTVDAARSKAAKLFGVSVAEAKRAWDKYLPLLEEA